LGARVGTNVAKVNVRQIDPLHYRVDREDHERQERMNHSDVDPETIVDELNRMGQYTQSQKRLPKASG
jgi:hypothetical protein